MSQTKETLEEAAKIAWQDYEHEEGNLYSTTFRGGFIAGAKWQQERMYSEEEVIELLRKSHFVEQNIDEWFEQFKKK